MKRFTQGRWAVNTEANNQYWRADGTEVASEYGRIADTSVSGLRDLGECQANALLIAAAPEMLDVLRAVAEHFKDTDAPLGSAARAMIAKATGAELIRMGAK